MSDERLRELERVWKQSGADEDEAAWLRQRVREGELAQGRLETAALLGHEAACIGLESPEFASEAAEEWADEFWPWLFAVGRDLGPEGLVRVALAASRAVLPLWKEHVEGLGGTEAEAIAALPLDPLLAVEAFLTQGGRASEVQPALIATESVMVNAEAGSALQLAARSLYCATNAAYQSDVPPTEEAAELAALLGLPPVPDTLDVCQRMASEAAAAACHALARARTQAADAKLEDETDVVPVENAVYEELVPWLLGYGDPIREGHGGRADPPHVRRTDAGTRRSPVSERQPSGKGCRPQS